MVRLIRRCKTGRAFVILALIVLAAILCSCGLAVKTDLTLYTDEYWKMESRVTIPAEVMTLVSGGIAGAEANLDKTVAEAKAAGASARWRREKSDQAGMLVYVLETEGTGFGPPLARDIQVEKVDYDGHEALKVTIPSGSTLAYSGFSQNLITVRGGQLLESNGTYTSTETVTWTNPSSGAYAILTPRSRFLQYGGWVYVLGSLIVVGVAAGLYLILRRQRISSQTSSTVVASTARYCPTCGAPVLASSRFCMQCGQPIPYA